jgi:hypothetical protein
MVTLSRFRKFYDGTVKSINGSGHWAGIYIVLIGGKNY